MKTCSFCRIVADPTGSHVVWEDDTVLAFLDINPVTDGHVLVVPKHHSVGLDDIPAGAAARMMHVAQELSAALKRSQLRCQGVNLLLADGAAASQEIFHSHLHVIPRFEGDGFTLDARWDGRTEAQLAAAAGSIRKALAAER